MGSAAGFTLQSDIVAVLVHYGSERAEARYLPGWSTAHDSASP